VAVNACLRIVGKIRPCSGSVKNISGETCKNPQCNNHRNTPLRRRGKNLDNFLDHIPVMQKLLNY
jgi:hypothetical protein